MTAAHRPTVVQVVRRFGPVGGMERYVWQLSHALAEAGESVLVACERVEAAPAHPGITLRPLAAPVRPRPRWLAYLAFGQATARSLAGVDLREAVVHSHERCPVHDVTTLHSELFDRGRTPGWLDRLSPREAAYRWMERRELGLGRERPVQVVPVSRVIARQVAATYPAVAASITEPISPGLGSPAPRRMPGPVPADGGVIGFVGKEWRRKGLPRVLAIAQHLQRRRPGLRLVIVGPDAAQVAPLCEAAGLPAHCAGWADSADWYARMDLLLHPAASEAYGMVIPEALACGVPVVVSDCCGASDDVPTTGGRVLPLSAPDADWAAACDHWLAQGGIDPVPARGWEAVARAYQAVYAAVRAAR